MIYSLRGTLLNKDQNEAIVECAGVGYKCLITFNTLRRLPELGQETMLYTYMNVREDAVELVGFAGRDELSCYKMLIGINGVGSKMAVAILSKLTPEQVALAVASGDSKMLTQASGVGNKIAQRILLELKDKLPGSFVSSQPQSGAGHDNQSISGIGNISDALAGLSVLGYSSADVMPILSRLDSSLPAQELIRLTLMELGRR